MKTIIIEVRGGVVQEVYSQDQHLDVVVIDWDHLDAERPGTECIQFFPKSMASLSDKTKRAVSDKLFIA